MKRKIGSLVKFVFALLLVVVFANTKCDIFAAVDRQNTETEKVNVDSSVKIASSSKYKDVDYSYLRTIKPDLTTGIDISFSSLSEMIESKSAKIQAGKYVYVKGFYKSGDGGAAVFLLSGDKNDASIEINDNLYANIQPLIYQDAQGVKWAIINILALGADPTGKIESHNAINNSIKLASSWEAGNKKIDRGLVYFPQGEFKCGDKIGAGASNVNIIGEGENTILFTDNDYRDEEGYSEFFFEVWGAKDSFIGFFQIEAREVDLYHYMRQLVILYCQNVYIYQVDTIVPQESYNAFYFEDKQYSNVCCYTGNETVTIDDCVMKQLSGTYRGANLGVLDIWSAGENNITIMNCELYGNARDEQIGFFSREDVKASVRNVNFINNTVHSVQIKYPDIIGTRTMCFSIAYATSENVENIRVAGNHFIMETDSKFMTFGAVKNCVIENNIIEVKCTYMTWSVMFDASNEDPKNIVLKNNDIFITSNENLGRGCMISGGITLEGNRVLSDVELASGVFGNEIHNNKFIFLEKIGYISANANITKNEISLFKGLGAVGSNRHQIAVYGGSKQPLEFSGNKVLDYMLSDNLEVFQSVFMLNGDVSALKIDNNEMLYPNVRYTTNGYSEATKYTDENGTYYKNALFRERTGVYTGINVKNNTFQGVEIPNGKSGFTFTNNKEIDECKTLDKNLTTAVKLYSSGKEVKEITTTSNSIDLDDVEYIALQQASKKVIWYVSTERNATVTQDGLVSRKLYGDVYVYAVPLDGSGVYGKCLIHFAKALSQKINSADSIEIQPERKYYMDYTVLPKTANQALVWTSANESIATVDVNGTITGVKEGTTVIMGTTTDGTNISKKISVVVKPLTVKKIQLSENYKYFEHNKIGSEYQLSVKEYIPENATNKSIKKWTSDNEKVATVDNNGKVKIVGPGKAQIRAYSQDEFCYGKCQVYVQYDKVKKLTVESYTNNAVSLRWDETENCEGYFIYQWNTSEQKWDMINQRQALKKNYFTVDGLNANTEYKFNIQAYNSGWDSGAFSTYVGLDSIVSVKTLSYIPITKLECSKNVISVPMGLPNSGTILSYNPKDANYSGLKLDIHLQDTSVAVIDKIENIANSKSGRTVTISGKKYGTTKLIYSSNDDWKQHMEIPVGVLTNASLEKATYEITNKGAKYMFKALKDEASLVKSGAMTGYMVMRTQGIEFSDLAYIPAEGKSEYEYLDISVTFGDKYSYTVTPCLKDGDNYFEGYNNGFCTIKMPDPIKATSVVSEKDLYEIKMGEKVTIKAKVEPANVSKTELHWKCEDEDVADITRLNGTTSDEGYDCAVATGKTVGITKVIMDTVDNSAVSGECTIIVTPGKVENVQKAISNDVMGLIWKNIDNASGYLIYALDDKKVWKIVGDVVENAYIKDIKDVADYSAFKVCAYIEHDKKKYMGIESDVIEVSFDEVLEEDPISGDSSVENATKNGTNSGGNNETNNNTSNSNIVITNEKIIIVGYRGTFDAQDHNSVTVSGLKDGDVVEYSIDNENWSNTIPSIKNVSESRIVFIRLKRDGKQHVYSVIAKVDAVDINTLAVSLSKSELEWTGSIQNVTVKFNSTDLPQNLFSSNEYTISYSNVIRNVGEYVITVKGHGNIRGTIKLKCKVVLKTKHNYLIDNYVYRVLSDNTVSVFKSNKKLKNVTIKNSVNLGGKVMKVTQIETKAFANNSKLKKVTVGSNVKIIKNEAFTNNKKLTLMIIKSKKITKIGKNAFKGTTSKLKIKVYKTARKKWLKLLKSNTGFKGSVVVIK